MPLQGAAIDKAGELSRDLVTKGPRMSGLDIRIFFFQKMEIHGRTFKHVAGKVASFVIRCYL